MRTHRLNIDFPADEFKYLKMLCTHKGLSMKDFLVPVIMKAIEDEEDEIMAQKAAIRLKKLDLDDCIPFDEAIKLAGWHDKEV